MTIAMHEVGAWVFELLAILSVKALVLVLPVWAAVRLLRPIRPALEHGIWTAVLVCLLLLPLTSLIGFLPESAESTLRTEVLRLDALAAVEGNSVPGAGQSDLGSWQSWGGIVYLIVLGFFAGRLTLGYRRAACLVSGASEIKDTEARGIFDALIVSTRLAKQVTLLVSPATPTPVTLGGLRAAVLLPDSWREWPSGKLRGVLVHELSHIGRRDPWVAVVSAVNCTLFWFHPLSWWLRTRLTSLAEKACDDRTVLLTRDREGYAETLLLVASQRRKKDVSPVWPVPAMARTSRVTERIERILSISRPDSGLLGWRALSRVSVAMMAWLLVVGSISPAWARQGITLSGTVRHASGAGIRNASVFISDAEDAESREVTTARMDGTYSLSGLESGRQYIIEALSRGFVTFRDVVTVFGDQRFDITLRLLLGNCIDAADFDSRARLC